ncbi:MAG TPA: ABC transporter permease [bacterium]|nr:ABC transporter permease [bacterium]
MTLFGITIGIFAIISVFTVIDSLERSIRTSLSTLGSDIVYVQKWPWTPPAGEEYAWWEYLNRPVPKLDEYQFIKEHSLLAQAVVFQASTRKSVTYKGESLRNISVSAFSHDYNKIQNMDFAQGRYFNRIESAKGMNLAIIGSKVAEELYGGLSPVGRNMKVGKNRVTVIGVLEKKGKDFVSVGENVDESVLLPLNFARRFLDLKSESASPAIIAKAKDGVPLEDLSMEMENYMRNLHQLKPAEKNDFSLNVLSMINNQLNSIFGVINMAGWLIGGFSIIVGGFGIANIMFVSVKERTKQIGIQKALGAKNYFILSQFLFEAVLLSIIGGGIGLLLIFLGSLIANLSIDLKIMLTFGNILLGLFISVIIGIISGLAPAQKAARLDPVIAINSTF